MLALPEGYRPLAVDLRGFGATDPEPVDATRGLGDYADDLAAVIEALGLTSDSIPKFANERATK
jgi:pimeloyl-ACP methyl ester carboxylesterase